MGSEPKTILERVHSRSLIGMAFTGVLSLGLAGAGVAVALSDSEFISSPLAGKIVGGFFVVLFGLAGILMLRSFFQKIQRGSAVLRAIQEGAPERIESAEFREIRVRGGRPAHLLFFKLTSGEQEAFSFSPKQKQAVHDYLRKAVPSVVVKE